MNKELLIEKKVEEAMDSINFIHRAHPSPYFFTRVLSKLENRKETLLDKWNSLLLKPSLAMAVLGIIILLNAMVIYYNFSQSKISNDQSNLAISDEYSQSATPSFYLENIKP